MPREGRPENLIRNEDRTPEERRENARKAGFASGHARRQKKLFTQVCQSLLESKVTNKQMLAQLSALGLGNIDGGATFKDMATLGVLKAAIAGNISAFEKLQELTGELVSDANTENLDNYDSEIFGGATNGGE